ncbi:hypothetical protein BDP27DRAFT_271788 [Rhodocollybia butyracea]|uniref:Uncharacterized protein n=1 Tax=Rhodocollybia butyracea TaxID=206335 RepID=A0A9P5UC95_9AGAR|nr:hypothetical protein BDP27DRAFT_271788 [Rhodocollybia butyracea]
MASTSTEPSEISIRITRSGKIAHWVTYVLECLQKNDCKPITLHTLPKSQSESNEPEQFRNTSNITTPRLISVVEIIKREYLSILQKNRSTRLIGLHQYNEIGSLEELGQHHDGPANVETEAQRAKRIALALEGKNFPKQIQSPYMRITLSLHELPELVKRGATYQRPLIRTLSKAAKKRAKASQKKATRAEEGEGPAVAAGMETS